MYLLTVASHASISFAVTSPSRPSTTNSAQVGGAHEPTHAIIRPARVKMRRYRTAHRDHLSFLAEMASKIVLAITALPASLGWTPSPNFSGWFTVAACTSMTAQPGFLGDGPCEFHRFLKVFGEKPLPLSGL